MEALSKPGFLKSSFFTLTTRLYAEERLLPQIVQQSLFCQMGVLLTIQKIEVEFNSKASYVITGFLHPVHGYAAAIPAFFIRVSLTPSLKNSAAVSSTTAATSQVRIFSGRLLTNTYAVMTPRHPMVAFVITATIS